MTSNDRSQEIERTTHFLAMLVFIGVCAKAWQLAEHADMIEAARWVLGGILISGLIIIGGRVLGWLQDWTPPSDKPPPQ